MRASRRQFVQGVGVAGAGLLAGCGRLPGQAGPATRVYRVGHLASSSRDNATVVVQAFREDLQELGYVEGQNLLVEWRWADGQVDRLPDLAADLVRLQVDAIVAPGNPAARAAKDATTTIPIVATAVRDPVGTGLVASLARPGGNVTGLSLLSPQLAGKRLELLKEAVPSSARPAVLWEGIYPDRQTEYRELQTAAQALGVPLQFLEVRQPSDFASLADTIGRERIDTLITLGGPLTLGHRNEVVDLTAKLQLPTLYDRSAFVVAGGLMSYGPNDRAAGRRAVAYVDKILKGANPAELPVEQPREFEFVINLKTAQALGLTIPEHVLLQATEVIQ